MRKNVAFCFSRAVKVKMTLYLRQTVFLLGMTFCGIQQTEALGNIPVVTTKLLEAMQTSQKQKIIEIYNCFIVGRCFNSTESEDAFIRIKNSLRDDEIAIEMFIVSTEIGGKEYAAFTVRQDYDAPHVCMLFDEEQLSCELKKGNDLFTDTVVASMLLAPLQKELCGVRRIFMTPAGKLHQFAVEYCNVGNGVMLTEKYEFFRLTSSAVLTGRKEKQKPYKSYVIYGGIDFDMAPDYKEQYIGEIKKSPYGYLEAAYQAAIEVHHNLANKGLNGTLYANEAATETAVKALSGKNISILFIETHGVVNPEHISSNFPDALMFAGASYVIEGGVILDGKDDGLLTCEEISQLDLANVDLAAISACQSALGNIDEQGVDGLMRAFKTAGVNTLVMATDNVVDYVSGEIWKVFFQNIANGKSKRVSLLGALKHAMTIKDGFYKAPKYWAGFILLDGID